MSIPWIVAFISLWLVVLLIAMLSLGLMRRVTWALERAERRMSQMHISLAGLPPGTPVPMFRAKTRDGLEISDDHFAGASWIALFLSSGCQPCEMLVRELRQRGRELSARLLLIVNDSAAGQELTRDLPFPSVVDRDRELSTAFQTIGTPHAFAIDGSGVVVESSVASTVAALDALALTAREEVAEKQNGRPRQTLR